MSNNLELLVPSYSKASELLNEYEDVQKKLTDNSIISNQDLNKKFSRRFAELNKVIPLIQKTFNCANDIETTKELAKEDPSLSQEIEPLEKELANLNEELGIALMPKDEDDSRDIIMEIKGGAGGEESKLFAGDLLRMYQKFAANKGWKLKILEASETGIGGYNNIELSISSTNLEDDGVWHYMKFEGGVHRVQRVPVTESQGRIHTSAVGVLVFPEVESDDEVEIDPSEVKTDVFRAGGPGGQSVNTTDSAVRLTHIPTGIVVSMQNEKSQIQNRAAAMKVLKSRILAQRKAEEAEKAGDMRKAQVRTLDRSERIRTYNFPENRISDHRSNYKSYALDSFLEGNLDDCIQSLIDWDIAQTLEQ